MDIVPNPSVETLQLTVYGLGTVGALTVVTVLVTWLKALLGWTGHRVRWLTTGVAAYVTGMLFSAAFYPPVALGMGALFLVAVLATTADAFFLQNEVTTERQNKLRDEESS